MLELKDICYTLPDGKEILKHIDLTVQDNEFMVITGPNGGGKSTLAKLIAGIVTPTSGQILLDGQDITGLSITDRANMGVSFAFQQPVRFRGITVRDLLSLASGQELSVREACGYLTQVGLHGASYVDREVNATFSGGELKRIEIAIALARESRLSIFDEPEAGIDLWSFKNLIAVFEHLHEQNNGSIMIISHQERILNIADEIVVIANGQVANKGSRDEIYPQLLEWGNRSPLRLLQRRKLQMNNYDLIMDLVGKVSDISDLPAVGTYNIRADGCGAARQNSENIEIITKTDKPGIDIMVKPGTKGETVYIPAIITHGGVDDLVYNDFYIGEDADVTIVAGCGVHNCDCEDSHHNGIHRFFLAKNSKVLYLEKHYGEGDGTGKRIINPETEVFAEEGSSMEMDTVQIKGVDSTKRVSKAELKDGAKLVITEKIMTHGDQTAETSFDVIMTGKDSSCHLVSRSVARDRSKQVFRSYMRGDAECYGHSECDGIIMDDGVVSAIPEIIANDVDARLIHEAAIGKIAGEQLIKLMTLGLTEQQAEEQIIGGFLK